MATPEGVGIGSGTGDWGSQTFSALASDDNQALTTNEAASTSSTDTTGTDPTTMAILAAIAGVLGIAAAAGAALTKKEEVSIIPEGNGLWVAQPDRERILATINNAASKQYYIDSHGFVRAVERAEEDPSKSSTYSQLIDNLIAGDKKVIIGQGSGYTKLTEGIKSHGTLLKDRAKNAVKSLLDKILKFNIWNHQRILKYPLMIPRRFFLKYDINNIKS